MPCTWISKISSPNFAVERQFHVSNLELNKSRGALSASRFLMFRFGCVIPRGILVKRLYDEKYLEENMDISMHVCNPIQCFFTLVSDDDKSSDVMRLTVQVFFHRESNFTDDFMNEFLDSFNKLVDPFIFRGTCDSVDHR